MARILKALRAWMIVVLIAVVGVAIVGWQFWKAKRSELPKGIASGNGRIEAQLVDVSAKEPLRVKKILVEEGDLVRPGQILVQLDTVTLDAQLAEAGKQVAATKEKVAGAEAAITKVKAQIQLAQTEADRYLGLVEKHAASQQDYDQRAAAVKTTTASLGEAQATLKTARQDVAVAEANRTVIQTRIDDATLKAPVLGRVLYRLVQPGEVLGPGGKGLTLVNLENVYMEIYLPSADAAALKIGSEGRITVDYEPGRSAVGYVSFVSPQAQFTPKEVETKSEREKLVFRVKIQVPKSLVEHYIQSIKTGVRGVGYVKVNDNAAWPNWLQSGLLNPNEPEPKVGAPSNEPEPKLGAPSSTPDAGADGN